MDWDEQRARCPQGKTSATWHCKLNAFGTEVIHVRFRAKDCFACRLKKVTKSARSLLLQPKAHQEALTRARAQQLEPGWWSLYNRRAGIEGTFAQGVRLAGLRVSRYRGLVKTNVQQTATAAGISLVRVNAWLLGEPWARTRVSRFAALQA